jgi:hypothetical protein
MKDSVLMPIRGEGLMEDDADGEQQQDPQQVTYVLHPNCGIFEED